VLGYFGEDLGAAIALIDRSLELNPSFALGWEWSGWLRLWAGQPDVAIDHFGTSMRLNPLHRRAGPYLGIGMGHFFTLRFEDAAATTSVATRNSRLGPDLSISCVMLRAYGPTRRSARHGSAAARHNDRGGPECRALAQPRAPRTVRFGPAFGGWRRDMSQTRRLAAILAADVAGYSRLMGVDEEGTLERLKALCREFLDPKIAEHHGRIVQTTGDGMLVEFASVVDAVRCAVEVQQAMPERNISVGADNRIELRIGINLGDVIVEGDDLYGDGVNIAARVEALADAGGVFVSNTVYNQVRDRLPFVFEDLGEQQVKNIARAVRVYRVRNGTRTAKIPAGSALQLPDKPSVAVLAFTNMSVEPEQEFFADGIAEDVITALSRYPSSFVIARNSSVTYKGRAVDVKQVGRDLGVRYVLEGSLRKSGNRIRVTAQLVEAETGKHVWAERYDRDLADIFAVQDEITEAVTIAVAPAIADAELRRAMRKPPENLDAWAACQRGLWHFDKATVNDYALAEKFFRQAVDLDPNLADGYCGLAMVQIYAAAGFGTGDLADALGSIGPLARQAVSLDANNAVARSCVGFALFARGDYNGALVEAERALALSPNLAAGYWQRGNTLIFAGQPEKGPNGSANEPQARSTRLEFGASPISLRDRLLFLTGLRGRRHGGEQCDPGVPGVAAVLPLSRRSARTARPDRRSEGGARKSDRGRPGRARHVRPRASTVVPVGRPRPPARRSAQGGVGGMTASRRLAAILAADVAGFSRLIGADEEGTLEGMTRRTCSSITGILSRQRTDRA
jgi:adenylate cyclase